MPSTFTPLGVEKMVTGEKSGQWGTLTNANWNLIEQISGGYQVQTLNAAGTGANTTTLAVTDGGTGATLATRVIILGAVSPQAITGNKIVTIPLDVENWYLIKNSTSGSYTVQFKYVSGSGTTVTWAVGAKDWKIIYAAGDDATNPNVVEAEVGGVTPTNTVTLSNKTLTEPKFADGGFIADTTGAETLVFGEVSSPLNEFKITNAASGNGPILSSQGQTNVPINITPAGTGDVFINPPSSGSLIISGNSTQAGKIIMQADTDDSGSFVASFQPGVLTESTNYKLPLAYATTTGFVLTSTDAGVLSWAEAAGGGTDWQAVETGATMTATAGEGYPVNTTAQACTATLPAGSAGDEVSFIDYARTFDTNNLTVASNGSEKIYASTDNLTVAVEGASFTLVYVDSTQGWLLKDH